MLAGRNGARGRTCTRTGDALDVVPLHWATRANGMEPPAGDAPAGIHYKRNPQAAAWRRTWPAEPKLNERRLVAVSGAAPDTADLCNPLERLLDCGACRS